MKRLAQVMNGGGLRRKSIVCKVSAIITAYV